MLHPLHCLQPLAYWSCGFGWLSWNGPWQLQGSRGGDIRVDQVPALEGGRGELAPLYHSAVARDFKDARVPYKMMMLFLLQVKTLMTAAPNWPLLLHLNLSRNMLLDEGTHTVALAGHAWKHLEHLGLDGNGIGDKGAKAMAGVAEYWPQLRHLDLKFNDLSEEGVMALAPAAKHWTGLEKLVLFMNDFRDDAVVSLLTIVPEWRRLHLSNWPLI